MEGRQEHGRFACGKLTMLGTPGYDEEHQGHARPKYSLMVLAQPTPRDGLSFEIIQGGSSLTLHPSSTFSQTGIIPVNGHLKTRGKG